MNHSLPSSCIDASDAVDTPETRLLREARERVDAQMGFLGHLMVFLAVNAGLFLLSGLQQSYWSFFPLWGWGLGLAIHGLATLAKLRGPNLRQQLMARELARLRSEQRQA